MRIELGGSAFQEVIMTDTLNNELSVNDFQRELFVWFEKRGLMSELRTFMRHRMISALYSSESPCPASNFSSISTASPTLQALLLLVAEFLVKQELHYTMSVMVAEAPLLASFPKFSKYVSYMSQADASVRIKSCDFPRYSKTDVQEILEVLGMTPDSEIMKHILRLYLDNCAGESLLACALTALSAVVQSYALGNSGENKTINSCPKKITESNNASVWIEEIRLMLLHAQLTSHQLQQVEDLLRKLQADTVTKAQREEAERSSKLYLIREQELQAATLMREEKFQARIRAAEEDLKSKQKHLEQVTLQLHQQHDEVLSRLNRVQKHADGLKRQEKDLARREKALEEKQAHLEDEHRILVGLRSELQVATQSLRQERCSTSTKTISELKHLQDRCVHLESELNATQNLLLASTVTKAEMGVQATDLTLNMQDVHAEEQPENHISSGNSFCSNTDKLPGKENSSQVSLLKRVLCRVQQENSELRAVATQQRKRIDELTIRAAQLAHSVTDNVGSSSQAFILQTTIGSQESPLPPPLPPRHVRSQVRDCNLANQNTSDNVLAASVSMEQHTEKYVRRKLSKHLIQHSNLTSSFSSDESPTEEIVREAKNRLRKLEEESEVVDRSYRDFQARQADVIGVNSPFSVSVEDTGNFKMNSGFDGITPFTQVPHAESSLPPSTLTSGPGQLPSTPWSSSIRLAPQHVSGLSSGISTMSRSRNPPLFPNRSVNSFPQFGNFSRPPFSGTYLANRTSVLRRPIDRLRNLLNGLSIHSRDGLISTDRKKNDLTDPVNSSESPLGKSSTKLNQVDGPQENIHEVVNVDVLESQVNYESSQPFAKDYVNQVEAISNLHEIELPVSISKKKTENQPRSTLQQSLIMDVGDGEKSKIDHETRGRKSSERQLITNDGDSEKIHNVSKPILFTEPEPSVMSLHIQSQSPLEAPVVLADKHVSPERQILKSGTLDATLNEVSTLSSSPAASVNAESMKVKAASDTCHNDGDHTLKADMFSDKEKFKDTVNSKSGVDKVSIQNENKDESEGSGGRANQLLHTSLSSIENSDFHVSVGSGSKKTDEDDDFW